MKTMWWTIEYISAVLSASALFFGIFFMAVFVAGVDKQQLKEHMPAWISQSAVNIRDFVLDVKYLPLLFEKSTLPEYQLTIAPEDMYRLESSVPDLEKRRAKFDYVEGIDDRLLDENRLYVPARFVANGTAYDVEVRIRGNGPPHWSFPKKSYRIKFSADNLFEGKREINWVIPSDRLYLVEQFNNFRAREQFGLIVPDSKMVQVSINGETPAVYWEVEHFTKEFLERHNLSGDIDLMGEADTFQRHLYTDVNYWQKYTSDARYDEKNYSHVAELLSLLNDAPDEIFYRDIFSILDEDTFYAWNIHNLLAASWHQDYSHNIRMAFDSSIGKFRIFPWDVYLYSYTETAGEDEDAIEGSANPLVDRLLKNEDVIRERNRRLWEYVKDETKLEKELAYYDAQFEQAKAAFYKDRLKRRSYHFVQSEVQKARNTIEENFYRLKELFQNSDMTYELLQKQNGINLILRVTTFQTMSPAYIEEIEIETNEPKDMETVRFERNGVPVCIFSQASEDKRTHIFECSKELLYPNILPEELDQGGVSHYVFYIYRLQKAKYDFVIHGWDFHFEDINTIKIRARNEYSGKKIKDVSGVFVDETQFSHVADITRSPAEFVRRHPQFRLESENSVLLPVGTYTFANHVVIPKRASLIIAPGTTINFVHGASLVSYSPVVASGTASAPITVRGQADGKGGNIAVLDNDGVSFFEHVRFFGGGEFSLNGAFFSGMLAIHHADSIVRYNTFENAQGDDALNIKYASSTVAYNMFVRNSADAIDYDFSEGVIEHNRFIDNGNDGIDTSGSSVLIQYNDVSRSGDKCISVGEKSVPVIFNNVFDHCHIGIEVKDLSEPKILNNVIINNDIGINAYQKKEIFGGGHGKVYNSIIWGNKEHITIDTVSTIEIEHSIVEGGYVGEGNTDRAPSFTDASLRQFTAIPERRILGNLEIVRELLGLKENDIPVGLYTSFDTP